MLGKFFVARARNILAAALIQTARAVVSFYAEHAARGACAGRRIGHMAAPRSLIPAYSGNK